MATTVEITLGDDKTLTVGIAEQPSADLDDSQQVANIDQAMAMAKHLLMNPPADSDEGSEGDDSDDASGAAGGDPSQAAGPAGAAGAAPAGPAGAAGSPAAAGAGGGDAQAMWNQLAQQQGPAH